MDLDSAIFYSQDIEKVIPFYVDILGFKVEYHRPKEFVSFMFANGVRLGIKTKTRDREKPGHQTVFIATKEIEKVYADLGQKKVNFFSKLIEQPWGKEFSLLDSDDNRILFVQRPDVN